MKKGPPAATEPLRDQMRHCVSSQINSDTAYPGYVCTYNWRYKNQWCRLYSGGCTKHEQFPESYDT